MYNTKFQNFEIKASYKGTKKIHSNSENFHNHMITITNTETEQKVTFEYWGNLENPEIKTEQQILKAFYDFVIDAIEANVPFSTFISNTDYDDKTAEKVYKKCKKQLEKLNKIYEGNIFDLRDAIEEQLKTLTA